MQLEKSNNVIQIGHTEPINGTGPLHYHNYFELELITSGEGSQLFNGQTFPLHEGDLYIVKPLDSHRLTGDNMVIHKIIMPEAQLPEEHIVPLYLLPNPIVLHFEHERYQLLRSTLFYAETLPAQTGAVYRKKLTATAVEMCLLLFLEEYQAHHSAVIPQNSVIANILLYIQQGQHYLQSVLLSELSEMFHYSKSYISRLFHRSYGIPLSQYINSLRIEHAKKLLLNSNLSIADVCIQSGFSSFPNFLNIFKRLSGLTPTAFRKKYKFDFVTLPPCQNPVL